jgi:hypothetical protein
MWRVLSAAALAAVTIWVGLLDMGHAQQPDRQKMAFTDPAEAGVEYQIQGEYAAEIEQDGVRQRVGVQIIALGDGKFRAVGFKGGLPGENANVERQTPPVDGQLEGEKAVFIHEGLRAEVQEGVLSIIAPDGNVVLTAKRIERRSPTLGAKPPEGAVVLFDGSRADAFQGGRMTDDGLLMEGATSKERFQDFTLHLEFRTPFMPHARGQARGNSGCYLQGRYEVQILDSFGLEGKHNECGGIYETRDPDVNMCLPPLQWQTYDIDYTAARYDAQGNKIANARITVRHNGVLVHENVELPKATRAAPLAEGPEPGPVFLQNHGNPVRFRNIWVVPRK